MIMNTTIKFIFLFIFLFFNLVFASEILVSTIFGNIKLTERYNEPNTELYIEIMEPLIYKRKEYIALTYYEPYPNSIGLRYVSNAVLERNGDNYKVIIDQLVNDGASKISDRYKHKAFIYEMGNSDLLVFSSYFRGYKYAFYILKPFPIEVKIQPYQNNKLVLPFLKNDELLGMSSDLYNLNKDGILVNVNISTELDPTCCPSRGNLDVAYRLINNKLEIVKVNRN